MSTTLPPSNTKTLLSLTEEDLEGATKELIEYLGRFGGIGGEGLLFGTAQVMLLGKITTMLMDRMWKDDRIRPYVQKVVDAFPRRGHVGLDLRRGPPT